VKRRKWLLDWLSDPGHRTDTEIRARNQYRKQAAAAALRNEETDPSH
jgi:hypothetical protein